MANYPKIGDVIPPSSHLKANPRRNPFDKTTWQEALLVADDQFEQMGPGARERVQEIVLQLSPQELSDMLVSWVQATLEIAHGGSMIGVHGLGWKADGDLHHYMPGAGKFWNVVYVDDERARLDGERINTELRGRIGSSETLMYMFGNVQWSHAYGVTWFSFSPARWMRPIGKASHYGTVERGDLSSLTVDEIRAAERNPSGLRANPAATSDTAARAIEKYQEFHRYDPKKLEEIECVIPAQLVKIGKATWVTYRSAKTDPETGVRPRKPVDYIHEHDAGVMLYMPVAAVDGGEPESTPAWLTKTSALVKLGTCLGFGFVDEGEACEAKSSAPMPDLWTTPDGKCLLVIQGKRTVMAVMYGGGLGVEGRGIVG